MTHVNICRAQRLKCRKRKRFAALKCLPMHFCWRVSKDGIASRRILGILGSAQQRMVLPVTGKQLSVLVQSLSWCILTKQFRHSCFFLMQPKRDSTDIQRESAGHNLTGWISLEQVTPVLPSADLCLKGLRFFLNCLSRFHILDVLQCPLPLAQEGVHFLPWWDFGFGR